MEPLTSAYRAQLVGEKGGAATRADVSEEILIMSDITHASIVP